jgi:hypothetical protein
MNSNRFMRRGKYETARVKSIRSAYQAGRAAFLNEQARQRQEEEKQKKEFQGQLSEKQNQNT